MNTDYAFHPLADIFPLMEGAEFEELVADIRAHGQHAPIVLKDGMILDGRNRYRACLAAGIEPLFASQEYSDRITDALAYVISANIRRRHLTAEQKRDLIAELLKADPSKSDRQIAETIKASPTFVGKVRAEKEASGDVSTVDTRTDTKGRKQPARKRSRSAKPAPKPGWSIDTCIIGPHSDGEIARKDAELEELRNAKRRLEIENTGLRSELEELRAENANLRARLAGATDDDAEASADKGGPNTSGGYEAAFDVIAGAVAQAAKRRRGRPKGSKNKPKAEARP